MDCWINKENLKIREGKKEELQSFLEEALDKKGCTLEELFCSYLHLDEIYFEDEHICLVSEGIYDEAYWKDLAPFLEGFVEWSNVEGAFRDLFEDGAFRSIAPVVRWENEAIEVPHLKEFLVYLDDGHDAFRVPVPAANLEAAKEYVNGNGEIVAIKDVTGEYPIGLENVREALNTHFGETEMALILRTLEITGVAE